MRATIQKLTGSIRRRLQSAQQIELDFNEYCKLSDLMADSDLSSDNFITTKANFLAFYAIGKKSFHSLKRSMLIN
jgi:hypothetical protein